MRFRNLSKTETPKKLWKGIARKLKIHKNLPKAEEYGILIYTNKTLQVTIDKPINQDIANQKVILGTYSSGSIFLYPCPKYTIGFLTFTYLHEICLA